MLRHVRPHRVVLTVSPVCHPCKAFPCLRAVVGPEVIAISGSLWGSPVTVFDWLSPLPFGLCFLANPSSAEMDGSGF